MALYTFSPPRLPLTTRVHPRPSQLRRGLRAADPLGLYSVPSNCASFECKLVAAEPCTSRPSLPPTRLYCSRTQHPPNCLSSPICPKSLWAAHRGRAAQLLRAPIPDAGLVQARRCGERAAIILASPSVAHDGTSSRAYYARGTTGTFRDAGAITTANTLPHALAQRQ